jgi:membrane-associated protease RseP (regulator of RpoE activity)
VAVRRLLPLALALPLLAQAENRAVLGVVAVEGEKGVFLAEVVAGSPAASAGLRAGDRLVAIDGKDVRRAADVDRALAGRKEADEVRVAYRRGDAAGEARAKLAVRGSVEALRPRKRGETGFEAPPWHAYAWANVGAGKGPSPSSAKGKVLVIHAFQSWCPGCARWGFPVMKQVEDAMRDAPDVVVCHVQTVFEGAEENTPERGPKEAAKYGVRAPVGFDARVDGASQSLLMERFGTGGTPWTIVIDRKGVVRFNGATPADSRTIVALVEELRKS